MVIFHGSSLDTPTVAVAEGAKKDIQGKTGACLTEILCTRSVAATIAGLKSIKPPNFNDPGILDHVDTWRYQVIHFLLSTFLGLRLTLCGRYTILGMLYMYI